jgi:formate dehydrogenase subunit gamma
MTRSPLDPARPEHLLRFVPAQRWVHRSTGILMGVVLLTAAALYLGPLSVAVGHRALVADIHIYCGIALPVPFLLGYLDKAFRADVRALSRWLPVDRQWLRSPDRRSGRLKVGKFNAGQKLNASFIWGAILVMLGTGLVMRFANHWPVSWRTGATFVHDWLAYAVAAVVVGHLWFAFRDPQARHAMRTGFAPLLWAIREHRGWAQPEYDAFLAREQANVRTEQAAAQLTQDDTGAGAAGDPA